MKSAFFPGLGHRSLFQGGGKLGPACATVPSTKCSLVFTICVTFQAIFKWFCGCYRFLLCKVVCPAVVCFPFVLEGFSRIRVCFERERERERERDFRCTGRFQLSGHRVGLCGYEVENEIPNARFTRIMIFYLLHEEPRKDRRRSTQKWGAMSFFPERLIKKASVEGMTVSTAARTRASCGLVVTTAPVLAAAATENHGPPGGAKARRWRFFDRGVWGRLEGARGAGLREVYFTWAGRYSTGASHQLGVPSGLQQA